MRRIVAWGLNILGTYGLLIVILVVRIMVITFVEMAGIIAITTVIIRVLVIVIPIVIVTSHVTCPLCTMAS